MDEVFGKFSVTLYLALDLAMVPFCQVYWAWHGLRAVGHFRVWCATGLTCSVSFDSQKTRDVGCRVPIRLALKITWRLVGWLSR